MSYANALRKLSSYVSAIKTQIGAGITAALRPAIVALNELMSKLLKAAKAFTVFMQTLFPFQNGSSGMALADSADYADELADGTESAADGLEDASDAAKKLKKDLSVLPFDELNQLAKDKELASTSTKSVGGTEALPSLDMGGMFDWDGFYDSLEDQKLPDAINEWAKKIKEAFEEHNWSKLGYTIADGINEGIRKLYEYLNPEKAKQKIDPFISAVTTTLNSLIDGVNFELLGEALGNGLSIVTGAMNTFLEGFNWENFGTQLANGANGLVNGIDWDGPNGVGTLFANKLKAIWETADGFVTHFGWANLGTSLAKGATAFVKKVPYKTMAHAMATGINGIKTTVQNFVRGFPWTTLGKNLAAFSNDLVAWIDWSGITTTVGEGVNGIIDTFNSFFEDFDAEDFGTRLGTAITDFIGTVKWKDIGTALSNVWNKAWEFLKGFITSLGGQDDHIEGIYNYQNIDQSLVHDIYKGQQGTGIGKAIHDVIESAIRGINVDDMKEAINTLVSKVSQDIINVFGDQKMWYGLGQKIGETLAAIVGNPENAKKAASAINAIARGLDELLAGAIDALKKHWPNIKKALYNFLTTLDWGAVLGLAAPFIGAALASKLATFTFSKIKTVLASKIGGVFNAVGKAEGTKLAAGNIFKTIIDAIGPGGVEGGLIAAVVLATAEIQKFQELASGGNGVLTEEGGIIDSMISQMLEMGSTTKTTTDKLFDLKEEWEGGNISDEEFFSQATTILSEGGVSADEFKNAMIRLKDKVSTTNTQMGVLDEIMSGLPKNTELASEKLDEFGGKDVVIDKVRAAIQTAGEKAFNLGDEIFPGVAQSASERFAEMVRSGSTFEEAIKRITEEFGFSDEAISAINSNMSETFGAEKYNSIVSETGTATEQLFGFFKYVSGGVSSTNTELNIAATRTTTLSGKISSMSGAVGAATTKTSGFADKLKTVNERTQTQAEKTDNVNTKLTNYSTNVDSASTKTSTLSTNTNTANTKLGLMATAAKTAAEKNDSLATKADKAASNIKTQGENADTAEGYLSNYNSTNEKTPSLFASVSKMLGGVLTTLLASYGTKSDFEGKLKEDVEGAETGIKDNSYLVEDAAKTMGQNTADAIDSYTMQEEFKSAGENDAKAVGTGMQNAQLDSASIASDMLSGMKGYLEGLTGEYGTAWWWGRNIADAIANGLKSVKLPIPKFSQTDWSEYKLDDNTSMWLPVFSSSWEIPWYAKGGLFTNPSIVGIGEAGRETVLPLENKRTMGMIADAIINNSNGIGMDEETLASAVARGYVQAMMANQGNQQQPIYNIVVKTENDEVLARAVQRGNQALDYRNNPTPKLAY